MKCRAVPSEWIRNTGGRLDCQPFLSGAVEARVIIESGHFERAPLRALTKGYKGGIFNGPQFKRNYVTDPKHGVRFLTTSNMLRADLSNVSYLSKKDAESNKLSYLRLEAGTTLISCSGTIGRMVYARPDMEGMWTNQDILKVVPDPDKIPPGYLYAFLSSKFGVPLVTSGTYGAIIQHIEPEHIADLPVPRLGEVESRIHDLVARAAERKARSARILDDLVQRLPEELGISSWTEQDVADFSCAVVNASRLDWRFEGAYHSKAATTAERALDGGRFEAKLLFDVIERGFKPPIFKRIWVESSEFGPQFVSGNDAYRYAAEDERYVSRLTPNFDQFILQRGWVVFQAAGQISGLFGRPLLVSGWLDGIFAADDLYRVVPKRETDGGYLYAFFRTKLGHTLIKRQAAGNSIPRVWDPQMSGVRIPWPDDSFREKVGKTVLDAHDEVARAQVELAEANDLLESSIEAAA